MRHILESNFGDYAKAVDVRHLNVEKDEIGMLFANAGNCFTTAGALCDDLDIVTLAKKSRAASACEWLVISDQHLND
jgi:hypothetical protein